MSDGFQRRMRRRARMAAIARIVFAIFGVVALGGTTVLRMSRGCTSTHPPASHARP